MFTALGSRDVVPAKMIAIAGFFLVLGRAPWYLLNSGWCFLVTVFYIVLLNRLNPLPVSILALSI
jgi:hypothetical protein